MASAPNSSEPTATRETVVPRKGPFASGLLHLPGNVYLLLFFTLGKGFQLTNPFG